VRKNEDAENEEPERKGQCRTVKYIFIRANMKNTGKGQVRRK
jgi:hypothetical protein